MSVARFPLRFSSILGTLICVSIWGGFARAGGKAHTAAAPKTESCAKLSADECDLFRMTNQVRATNNLPALKFDAKCQEAAEKHVADMARRHFYSHINPDGQGLAQRYPGLWFGVGENIVMGDKMDNAAAIQSWMKSPGHRKNILDANFTHLGVAHLFAGGEHYYLQCFVKPRSDYEGGPGSGLFVGGPPAERRVGEGETELKFGLRGER